MSKRALPFSSFTLIVVFVCLSLIGLALVPLLPVKLSPSRNLPAITVSFNGLGSTRSKTSQLTPASSSSRRVRSR